MMMRIRVGPMILNVVRLEKKLLTWSCYPCHQKRSAGHFIGVGRFGVVRSHPVVVERCPFIVEHRPFIIERRPFIVERGPVFVERPFFIGPRPFFVSSFFVSPFFFDPFFFNPFVAFNFGFVIR